MKLKSLLLGSAAALVAVSGARAADAVVIPEPEAVEYVRVCDAAGTGYWYIPGTETCLKISGYVRYEMNFSGDDDETSLDGVDDWGKRSEVRLQFEAWNDTELGPLYSRIRLGYDRNPKIDGDNDASGFSIDHAYFTIAGLTIGKNASWWDWGYGADGDALVSYGPGEVGMIAYTASFSGWNITLALEEDENNNYVPDVIFDVNGSVGDFGLHGAVAYNESNESWTAKVAGSYDFGVAAVQLGVQYTADNELFGDYGANYTWVLGADVSADVSEKLSVRAGFNYGIDYGSASGVNDWSVGAGVNYKVVSGFDIDARVNYADGDTYRDGIWSGRIRLTRSF